MVGVNSIEMDNQGRDKVSCLVVQQISVLIEAGTDVPLSFVEPRGLTSFLPAPYTFCQFLSCHQSLSSSPLKAHLLLSLLCLVFVSCFVMVLLRSCQVLYYDYCLDPKQLD